MEAEELLIKIKKFVEKELGSDFEAIVSPTLYNPNDLQFDISFIVMEEVKEGITPRFTVNVKDLKGIRNLKKLRFENLM